VEIPVIIELVGPAYRARCRHPVVAEAEGESRFEARQALEAVLKRYVGGPFETLPLEATDAPWVGTAGSVPDDELTEQWLDAVAEYRRARDAEDQASLPPAPNPQPAP
jgi:hypothetical protein